VRSSARIDIWSHAIPEDHTKRLSGLSAILPGWVLKVVMSTRELFDVSARFSIIDRFGDYQQVITPVPGIHLAIALHDPRLSTELVQRSNDGMASLAAKYPDRFRAYAALLPMHDPDAALVELDRVLKAGAMGVQIETNIAGVPLDDSRFEPLFARMADTNRLIWIHPFRLPSMPDYAAEKTSRYMMSQALGWPYETAVALSRLVFAGVLERYPALRVIGHHGGGMIPHFSGRLGRYLEVWGPRIDPEFSAALQHLKKPLLTYFRMFYVDTALNGAPHGVECIVDFFGADRVLFGTDTPFDSGPGEFIRDTIADVEALKIDGSTKQAVFQHNALRLLDKG
jgi:aminocarboxymuconate-semialdehyde decarboxylase